MADIPSYHWWRHKSGLYGKWAGVDIHHTVETYIQRFMGIDVDRMVLHNGEMVRLGDTAPGLPCPRNKRLRDAMANEDVPTQFEMLHKGKAADGGLSAILQQRIPTSGINPATSAPWRFQDLIDELYFIHVRDNSQFADLWPTMKAHLQNVYSDPLNWNGPRPPITDWH